MFFREASRVVLIPFRQADTSIESDDTELLAAQQTAGSAVSIFISLGKLIDDSAEVGKIAKKVDAVFKEQHVKVDSRLLRTYTTLMFFTTKVGRNNFPIGNNLQHNISVSRDH